MNKSTSQIFQIVLILMISSLLFGAKNGRVIGTVKDATTGEALPGANIIIEGTGIGTATPVNRFRNFLRRMLLKLSVVFPVSLWKGAVVKVQK